MTHYFNIQWTLKVDSVPVVEHRTFSFEVVNPGFSASWDLIRIAIEDEVQNYINDNSIPLGDRDVFIEQISYSFVE